MSEFASQITFLDTVRSGFRRAFASISRSFAAYVEAKSRRAAYVALESRSDAELAAMGLRRDQIARYVFRDLIHG